MKPTHDSSGSFGAGDAGPLNAGPFNAVLEDNLQRLMTRAWVPVVPAAEFRTRLSGELEARAAGRNLPHGDATRSRSETVPERAVPSLARTWTRRTFAAAAALLIVVAGIWIASVRSKSDANLELRDVLARNCVAVRPAGASGWRALESHEADRGLDVGQESLEVATPDHDDVRVRFGSSGQASLNDSTQVAVHTSGGETALALVAGDVAVERYDAGKVWVLTGCDARIELERGALELSIVDASAHGDVGTCLLVHVTRGVARAWIDGASSVIAPGTTLALRGDRALEAGVGVEDPHATKARQPILDAMPDKSAADPLPPATSARIDGVLRVSSGLGSPRKYVVSLLRRETLPKVTHPEHHAFDGPTRFTISGLEPGTYEVLVETADLCLWRTTDIELAAGATRTLDIELTRGFTVRGRIVDADTGSPIEGAVVLSESDVPSQLIPFVLDPTPPWSACAVTLSDGTFEIARLGAGPRVLRATKSGYGATWSPPVDPEDDAQVELRLQRGGSLVGHVARPDGTPWPDAIVIASRMNDDLRLSRLNYGSAMTDALGAYRIDDLPAGQFVVLNVLDTSGPASVRQADIAVAATTTIDLPEKTFGARFSGNVLDQDGRPLSGLDVTLQSSGRNSRSGWISQRSDAAGHFAFDGLHAGSFDVFVGTGYGRKYTRQDVIEVRAAGELVHDLRLEAGSIRGHVARTGDGTPCGDCFLLVESTTNPSSHAGDFAVAGIDWTNHDGTFAIGHLRPGTWRITAYPSTRGIAPQTSRSIVIASDSNEAACDIGLPPGAALRVTVRDADGHLVPGAEVEFVEADGSAMQLTANDVTGSNGVLDVPGIAAGKWSLSARLGDRASVPVNFDFVPGDEREIELRLAP